MSHLFPGEQRVHDEIVNISGLKAGECVLGGAHDGGSLVVEAGVHYERYSRVLLEALDEPVLAGVFFFPQGLGAGG